jgi:hypothetical protein
MPYLLRGALIEYGTDFLGPIPNVVIFQFNPESLTRKITIPPRPTNTKDGKGSQAGILPIENFTLKAQFSAADQLNQNNVIARAFGVGPRLAALEKMARPVLPGGILQQMADAVGDLIRAVSSKDARQPTPALQYPRLLFIWGLTRILPVIIDSMSITEQLFDALLNPIQAEVDLGLAVIAADPNSKDHVAEGALAYSALAKDAQVLLNLANTAGQVVDLIPF